MSPKKDMTSNFHKQGICKFGEKCHFSHDTTGNINTSHRHCCRDRKCQTNEKRIARMKPTQEAEATLDNKELRPTKNFTAKKETPETAHYNLEMNMNFEYQQESITGLSTTDMPTPNKTKTK